MNQHFIKCVLFTVRSGIKVISYKSSYKNIRRLFIDINFYSALLNVVRTFETAMSKSNLEPKQNKKLKDISGFMMLIQQQE